MNRIIWLFREKRSGSTWFTNYLCSKLNKTSVFLDSELPKNLSLQDTIFRTNTRQQVESDYKAIISTHIFELTTILKNYDNPIVLRSSRKNKFEQFLSWCAVKYSNDKFYNLHANKQNIELFEEFISKKFTVTRRDYNIWKNQELYRSKKYWTLTNPYENHTIYYEDLLDGTANIPSLNLYNIKMNDDDLIIRLPESYKKNMIMNYNEVETWFDNDKS